MGSDGDSSTPLAGAARNEHLEIVQYLVKTCSTVDLIGQTDSDGENSLHDAAHWSEKDVQLLQFLIENYSGGDIKDIINQTNKDGYTPLDSAYDSKYNTSIKKDIVSLLRKYGGKANCHDKNGKEVGKSKGDLNDVLNDAIDAVSLTSVYQHLHPKGTPLVCACEKGRLEDVRMLVEGHDEKKTGMSVDEMISEEGKDSDGDSSTPLAGAARNEHLEIVQYLVKTCSTVDLIGQTDSDGENSLHDAAYWSEKDVQLLQFLIENYSGGDIKDIINQTNKDGYTPLDFGYGSQYNTSIKKDIVSLLRKYGGKAN